MPEAGDATACSKVHVLEDKVVVVFSVAERKDLVFLRAHSSNLNCRFGAVVALLANKRAVGVVIRKLTFLVGVELHDLVLTDNNVIKRAELGVFR